MSSIQFTSCELDVIRSFVELTQKRAREPTQKKETNINAHSISKHCKRSYPGVKKAILRIGTKLI